MPGVTKDVTVFIHGLFLMTYNPTTGNLEIFAPLIGGSDPHHFVGGPIGQRKEIIKNKDINLTNSDYQGGGASMAFYRAE